MGLSLTKKIILDHLLDGDVNLGEDVGIKIDQTLTQDSTGTMTYLQFEAMGVDRVKTKRSVAYIDHNTLQTGYENADDHLYIGTVAKKHGIYYSKAGNGICHQVNLERYAAPGDTLIGADSHTPTAGGIGSLAFGAGGLDVAAAMAGFPYYFSVPKIVNVNLIGKLNPWVTAKDIILELLRRLSVKGGVSRIFEYSGDGVKTLTVPERATITNMGAELGATTSIFPSDEVTCDYLKMQSREEDWRELKADEGAQYDEYIEIKLDELTPMAALPHSPDNVFPIEEVKGKKIDQVAIGSCTNSSYKDLMISGMILKNNTVHPDVSLVISPGSKQVLNMLADNGMLSQMLNAGARVLEPACGPCIGMGQVPATDGVSLRTFNRNFEGRCGSLRAGVILASPEVAAASALKGEIADPRELGEMPQIEEPERFPISSSLIIEPADNGQDVEVIRGPNIKPVPVAEKHEGNIEGRVLIKTGNDITTDHIMPSTAKLLPLRSNIPALADYCFTPVDKDFPYRARKEGGGIIVGGENYGQGSSREHAALVPLYLGIKAVLVKSFARIHKSNLINNGILPMTFENSDDYEKIDQGDVLTIENTLQGLETSRAVVKNKTKNIEIPVVFDLSPRQKKIISAGGLLNYIKESVEVKSHV